MKLFNIKTALLALSALAFASCTDEYDTESYTPGEPGSGVGAGFSSATKKVALTPQASELFNITLVRADASAAANVNVNVVEVDKIGDEPFCTVPTSASFAAGSATATVTCTMNPNFELQHDYKLVLGVDNIDNQYASAVPACTYTVSVGYTWIDCGTVSVIDDWAGNSDAVDVKIQKAKEYSDADSNMLFRLCDLYTVLEGADAGNHIQFLLDKDYNPVTFTPSIQPIGEYNDGYGYWYYYYNTQKYADYCWFERDENVFNYGVIFAYGENGAESLYDGMTTTFTWNNGCPFEYTATDTKEEEVGQDFAVGAAFADYLGTYEMTYNGKVTEEVTITDNGDGTATLASFDDGVSFVVEYFGGLLYLGSQKVVIPGLEDYNFSLYPSDGNSIYDDVYLYAGFDEEGVLKFKNYPYNVTSQEDGSLAPAPEMNCFYIYDLEEGAYGKYSDLTLVKKDANKSASIKNVNYKKRSTNAKNLGKVSGKRIR